MQSAFFPLERIIKPPGNMDAPTAIYEVPTLPAYAIEWAELRREPGMAEDSPRHAILGKGLEIDGTQVMWHDYKEPLLGETLSLILIIYFHGIRDYGLLFPQAGDPSLSRRLGSFLGQASRLRSFILPNL